MDELPAFAYYPDPVGTEAFEKIDEKGGRRSA
jgi:uncharacterized protein CbrC (UPF0167 family)